MFGLFDGKQRKREKEIAQFKEILSVPEIRDEVARVMLQDEFKKAFNEITLEAKNEFIEKAKNAVNELRVKTQAMLSQAVDGVNSELSRATMQLQQMAATYQTDLQVEGRDIERVAARTSENLQSILDGHARRIADKTEEMVSSTINRVLYDHIDDRLDRAVADFIERGENASQHLTNKQIALRYGWSIREVKRRKRRG